MRKKKATQTGKGHLQEKEGKEIVEESRWHIFAGGWQSGGLRMAVRYQMLHSTTNDRKL